MTIVRQTTEIMGAPNNSSKTPMIFVPTLKNMTLTLLQKSRAELKRLKPHCIVSLKSDPIELMFSSVSQTDLLCDLHRDLCDVIGFQKGEASVSVCRSSRWSKFIAVHYSKSKPSQYHSGIAFKPSLSSLSHSSTQHLSALSLAMPTSYTHRLKAN